MNWLAARLCRFRSEAEKEPKSRPYGTLTRCEAALHGGTAALTRRDSAFTRAEGTLHGTTAPLHVPKALYPRLCRLTRRNSALTRDAVALHGAKRPLPP